MAALRVALLVAVVSGSGSTACAGESNNGERDEGTETGGAMSGGFGGAAPAGSGGAAEGGSPSSGAGGTSDMGGAGNGAGSGGAETGGAGAGMAALGGMGGGDAGSGGVIASCDDVTSCGGDVVGTWTVVDSCLEVSGVVDFSDFGLGCMSVPTTGSLTVTGTWSALADGVVLDETTTSGDAELEVPIECSEAVEPFMCPALAGPVETLGYASLACTDSASAWCDCSGTFEQTGGMAFISDSPATNATYTTADGVLTVSEGTNATEYSYCASENTLTLSLKSVGKTGTVTGTIVLQKQ